MIDGNVRRNVERTGRPVTALRILRVSTGLTQERAAAMAGIRRPTLSALENGHQVPRRQTALKIAEVLDQPVEVLFPEEKGVSRPN